MKQRQRTTILITFTVIAILIVIGTYTNYNGSEFSPKTQIIDMAGRNVSVSTNPGSVASITFSATLQIYMLAPDKLLGWNSELAPEQKRYIPAKYQNLPVVGGGKQDANYESFLTLNPDVIFTGHAESDGSIDKIQQKFGEVPVVDVEDDNNINNIIPSIKFTGDVLGEQKKADELITFYNNVSSQVNTTVSKIPENEKKRVYYARDPTGLQTDPDGGSHTKLIQMCGGVNVVNVPLTKGSAQVSMEQV